MLALVLVFTLGLMTGIVASQAREDAAADSPLALEAGQAFTHGRVIPLSTSFAGASADVPVQNAGSHDVTVLSTTLVGWSHSDTASQGSRSLCLRARPEPSPPAFSWTASGRNHPQRPSRRYASGLTSWA